MCTAHAPGVVAVELSADGQHWTNDEVLYTYIDSAPLENMIALLAPTAVKRAVRLGSGYECVRSKLFECEWSGDCGV
jgi:hypothetical protein